jgi:fucose 4-O-acetylase-like acetyltransferase
VEWPFTLVRVVAFYPFYAFGVLFRPQLDALAAAAAEKCSLRRAALAALLVGYGAYFLRVLLADPILDNSPQLFHDVSYAGGDTVGYRVVFYLAGILTTAALAVVFSSRHQLEGLGRHTLAIYLLHMPILAALIEFKFYDLMRGKPLAVVVLWFTLLACATLALLNWQPVQTAFDKLANCWYKRK